MAIAKTPVDQGKYIPSAKRTYVIVSQVAYLIGVKRDFFLRGKLQAEIFDQLDQQVEAKRIRSLCKLRNALMRNIREIENAFNYDMKNLDTLSQYFDLEDIQFLQNHGVAILKTNTKPMAYLLLINQQITNLIHGCSGLFPLWIEWSFIRDLFIMSDPTKEALVRKTTAAYCYNINWFPFQCFINWRFGDDDGNILHYDAKFISMLYANHGMVFNDYHMVVDAGYDTQNNFHRFIAENEKVTFIVDCENSDPYRLCATFRNLATHVFDYASHVGKVLLYDDVHTATTWRIFDRYVKDVPIDRKVVRRVKDSNRELYDVMTHGSGDARSPTRK